MEKLIAKIEKEFDDNEIVLNRKSEFKKFPHWDSLTALVIISMIDEDYGVIISDEELDTVQTIEGLYNMIISKKN